MKSLLITGGSGFIGHAIVEQVYDQYDRIVIYSRSEAKQAEMKRKWPEYPDNKMRYMIGDVRDKDRLVSALRGVTHVIHAAALKRVETAEYDPSECIKTNVIGAMNVIEACNIAGVQKCLTTSTDKAAAPETLYGSTKLCAERLFVAANNLGTCRFSICRYANVWGSTGSVIELWDKQYAAGDYLTVTDLRMTRMWIHPKVAAAFIVSKFDVMQGGEVFVPAIPGQSIRDIIINHYPDAKVKETGLRPSEKMHEIMITDVDSRDCYLDAGWYTIYPAHHDWTADMKRRGVKMPEGFTLTSEKSDLPFQNRNAEGDL